MSSTKRGGQRTESDNYPTPPWCVHRLLDRVPFPTNGSWYEPCAGEGDLIGATNTWFRRLAGKAMWEWDANELRLDAVPLLEKHLPRSRITVGDYLEPLTELPLAERVGVVITNPPYRIAWEVLHKSLREFPDSYIVLLLRLNFVSSQARHPFMTAYMPDIYVLPNRPGFKGWGKTDSPEYAWFVWQPSPRARTVGKIELLALTSLEERKRVPDAPTIYLPEGAP
jgi:hypothetical protein